MIIINNQNYPMRYLCAVRKSHYLQISYQCIPLLSSSFFVDINLHSRRFCFRVLKCFSNRMSKGLLKIPPEDHDTLFFLKREDYCNNTSEEPS